ncbi:MAG: acyl carrier protein [Hyphomicrobiales bacterium]|nr:acyl carrier protein [Hyphomicrobiales bacterium]
MQTLEANARNARVAGLVEGLLARGGRRVAAAPDARLADLGLNSADMVDLMLSVEAEFDVTIPQREITPENFLTVSAIERLLDRLA